MDGDFNVGRWLGNGRALLNQRMCCIRGKSHLLTRLLEYSLPIPLKAINEVTYATTVKHLASSQIEKTFVALPPTVEEQTAIAEFLDRETAKIDELVAEQRRLMELLKEKITSLVLSSVDLPNTKRLRFIDAASIISRPVLQQQDESYTRIGLFNRGRGLFHKDASEMDEMGESDFFWIEQGDLIISGQFAWEGAVAMAGKDDAGCVVSHRYPVIRGIPGVALTEYLFGLLCTNHGDFLLNENSRGAAGRNRPLNIRSLMKETIPIPSMQIQETVARAIHSRSVLFKEISNAINLLQERRTALISAAVTGQIDVRQQTRN
jgi:type I restriction enzyme, S subunit